MKVKFLRKKYPRFIYENYSYKINRGNLKISFLFKVPPDIQFRPQLTIKNGSLRTKFSSCTSPVLERAWLTRSSLVNLDNFVFHLGLIELLSYWKATCSPIIEIRAGFLNSEQIKWWKDLIVNGMGQFFYENKIDFQRPNFLKIESINVTRTCLFTLNERLQNRYLMPIGGGKDSIVTLEILSSYFKTFKNTGSIACFSLNPTRETKKIIKIAKFPSFKLKGVKKNIFQESIFVERKIAKKLLKLNRQGFLNGHTPFSAYLAFLSIFCAVLFDFKYIAFSNERSSNEGNVRYLGKMINHQYSKSFDFEKKFREYSKKYLTADVQYFSFLRPLYEIQIAKLFARHSKYFNLFLSCNEAYKTYSGRKKPLRKWCGNCPKCLFLFVILYPFVSEYRLIKIFKENLLKKISLLPTMLELIGERKFKPFECIGTKKESLIAFYLAWKKNRKRLSAKLPFLLKYFEKKILPKYSNLEKESKKLMNSWSNQHNLPNKFEKLLKNKI